MTPRERAAPRRPRAVVTGGAGFIGSHLVDRLLADGHAVLVIDDLSTGVEANLPTAAELERMDIAVTDPGPLLVAWRPDVVYHLAAQASVVRSTLEPLRDLEVNVTGTHRVAAGAEACGATRLVFVSSGGAIYGETIRPATERTRPAPASYYGVHKLAAEGHVRLAGISHAILRPSNVYGRRQAGALEGAVVAAFVEQAARAGSVRIHGDGTQTRDFVHVSDVVEALCVVAGAAADGTWNVASGRSVSIGALADHVERALGRAVQRAFGPARPGDVAASTISPAALRRLGWRPRITLDEGLAELVHDAVAGGASGRGPAPT